MKLQKKKRRLIKPHLLMKMMYGYRATVCNNDVWLNLKTNWNDFYWLTGETPHSFISLVDKIDETYPFYHRPNRSKLNLKNQILMTFIWLRVYPSMQNLAFLFGIPVSCVHKILHKVLKLLHAYMVPKYIKWHSMQDWRNLAGMFPEWPNVVAIVDCTPFRISKPKGVYQRLFYRKDRHCCFLNWLVIIDVLGNIVLSRPGFIGRTYDSACMKHVTLPVLPQGLQIMADQGFTHTPPIIVLPRANQPQLSEYMRSTFKSRRTMIERCFGILKNSYSSVSSIRFRSRKWNGPILANVCAANYNRKKLIFEQLRDLYGVRYMY